MDETHRSTQFDTFRRFTVTSFTGKNKSYDVIVLIKKDSPNNVISTKWKCSCYDFRMNKPEHDCKHITFLRENLIQPKTM